MKLLVDSETGEITENIASWRTEKQQEAWKNIKDYKKKQEEKEYAKMMGMKGMNPEYKEFGPFLFLVFSKVEELFPNLNNKSISMLIMLSSFLDYNNNLIKTSGQPMLRKDLARILDTSESSVSRFVSALKSEKILVVNNDGTMKINDERIYRGHIKTNLNRTSYTTTRIYINSCRELYYSCDKKNRSKLSYVYRLLPWINLEHNVLCWNPDEEDLEKLELMSIGDYAEEIGFGRENSTKLSKELFSFKLYNKPVILLVYSGDIKKASVLINPSLLYSGSNVGGMRVFFNAQADKEEEKKKR